MQETTQPQPAPVAPAPAAPQAPAPTATTSGTPAPAPQFITVTDAAGTNIRLQVPATLEELSALREHRDELGSQLSSVASRRRELANEILTTPEGASKQGLEARLKVLDQRIVQLETDLSTTGRLITLAPTELMGSTVHVGGGGGDDFEEGVVAGGFFSLLFALPAFYFLMRRRWKKRAPKRVTADMPTESAQRLERLEQGMESIAVEIERVSEGQRFVTRLLSEGQPASAAARRIAEPAHLPTIDG